MATYCRWCRSVPLLGHPEASRMSLEHLRMLYLLRGGARVIVCLSPVGLLLTKVDRPPVNHTSDGALGYQPNVWPISDIWLEHLEREFAAHIQRFSSTRVGYETTKYGRQTPSQSALTRSRLVFFVNST